MATSMSIGVILLKSCQSRSTASEMFYVPGCAKHELKFAQQQQQQALSGLE
jgi:hypothetical protein